MAAALTAALLAAVPAGAQSFAVSPADRATVEGSSSTSYPLGRYNARVQQLHADLGSAALTFTGHAYRRDAISLRGQVAAFSVDMTVRLSMSPTSPDQASTTFAGNAGSPVTVLPRTTVNFPATDRPGQAPAGSFALRIPYATPFFYPAGGGTLCVDTTLHGNNGPNGVDANFTAYLDAHEQFNDGSVEHPGYRYGSGCPAPGASNAASATFELRLLPAGLDLDVRARDGMASDAAGNAVSALIFGSQRTTLPWPAGPGCQFLTTVDATLLLSGPNSASGDWNGVLGGLPQTLPAGHVFQVQVASAHPTNGVTLSDGSELVMPAPGPMPITAVRIANGSDRSATTGTVSAVVPVIQFL